MDLFGTSRLRLTELELKLDALERKFRALEQEWGSAYSKFDAVIKRAYRFEKLEKKDADLQNPANSQLQMQELTPDGVMRLWEQQRR